MLKSQGDAYLLNHYYSVAVNAAFGVAAQVYNAVNMFLTNFQTAFKPQLVQTFAAGEMEEHYRLMDRASKFSFFLLLLIVVPITFNLQGLLGLWLKEVPNYTAQFCLIILMAYLVDAIGAPLSVSVNAQGNIKGMQIWSSILLLAGLVVGFLFLRKGAEPWIVSVITFAVHFGFLLTYMYYARKLCHVSLRAFFGKVVLPIVLVALLSCVVPFSIRNMGSESFWFIMLKCVVDLVWVGLIVMFVGLTKEERKYLLTTVLGKLNSKK